MAPEKPKQTTETEQKVYDFVRALCGGESSIHRAILFGSRARGDHQERSDFDLAIEAPGISDEAWARFALELRDKAPTLCGIDVVRLNSKTSKDLSSKIKNEGVKLYVRK